MALSFRIDFSLTLSSQKKGRRNMLSFDLQYCLPTIWSGQNTAMSDNSPFYHYLSKYHISKYVRCNWYVAHLVTQDWEPSSRCLAWLLPVCHTAYWWICQTRSMYASRQSRRTLPIQKNYYKASIDSHVLGVWIMTTKGMRYMTECRLFNNWLFISQGKFNSLNSSVEKPAVINSEGHLLV